MIAVGARMGHETRARFRPVRVVDRRYEPLGRDVGYVGLVAVRRELEKQAPRDPLPLPPKVRHLVHARLRGHLATLCPIPASPPAPKSVARDQVISKIFRNHASKASRSLRCKEVDLICPCREDGLRFVGHESLAVLEERKGVTTLEAPSTCTWYRTRIHDKITKL